jgi:hypothetical protein
MLGATGLMMALADTDSSEACTDGSMQSTSISASSIDFVVCFIDSPRKAKVVKN